MKSFKDIEKTIYHTICEIGQEITRVMMSEYDAEIYKDHDKKRYWSRGFRKTTIKTVYGECEFNRRVYKDKESGKTVFLLDEALNVEKVGLMSANLAETIVDAATDGSYRDAAEMVSGATGQTISHGGVWNLVQAVGKKIQEEENVIVEEMKADVSKGDKSVPLLFEEMDGVWLKMQGPDRKKISDREMKVSTIFSGWDANSPKRRALVDKKVLAGFESAADFHQKREAQIRSIYDADEIGRRVLNGDGGSWIRDPYDDEAVFQLDRFHVYQAIVRAAGNTKYAKEMRKLFDAGKIDELLDYIQVYKDSIESTDEDPARVDRVAKLSDYLANNRKGLPSYQLQLKGQLPEPPEGIEYRNMGVQEGQNCTIVTLRMKHRRMRWGYEGGNNMGKILYKKENGELHQTIDAFMDCLVLPMPVKDALKKVGAGSIPDFSGIKNKSEGTPISKMPIEDAARSLSNQIIIDFISGKNVFAW